MHVLITGGTGFIGSRLALASLNAGDKVTVTGQENTDAERENRIAVESAGAIVIISSLVADPDYEKLLDGVDIVFHLAAAQHEANTGDQHFIDVNVEATKGLLDACAVRNVSRFVYGSTIGVYGILDGRIDENSPCNPDNIYGHTKLAAEKVIQEYSDKLSVTIVRISETFGPGDRRLLKLFRTIKKGVFFIVGNGRNLHHLVYVDDLVRGLRLAATEPAAHGEICLLAGRESVSTRDMADIIAQRMNANVPKWHAPLFPFTVLAIVCEIICKPFGVQPPLHRRRMDFFKKSFTLSPDRARSILGYEPGVSFEEGVAMTARWYQEQNLLDS